MASLIPIGSTLHSLGIGRFKLARIYKPLFYTTRLEEFAFLAHSSAIWPAGGYEPNLDLDY